MFIADSADEANTDHALRLLDQAQQGDAHFLQPPHWVSEVAAVLVRLTPQTVSRSVEALLALSFVSAISDDHHYQRAISLALKYDHHLFETLYHAVALEEDITLITADKKYYDKARGAGAIVMLEEIKW